MGSPAHSPRSTLGPARRRCRSLAARCLAAVVIVASLIVGDVGAAEPVSAQSAATPTFSDPRFYSDVSPPERDLDESEQQRGGWIEHGRVWFETGPAYRIDSRSPYWAIQSLARAGVFEGTDCGRRLFCPDAQVQRWQFAVWLMRSLGEDELEPIDESRFADVDAGEWWAPYVERVAELGLTGGCSGDPGRYCPEEVVSRGELAAFLSRAFDLPAAEPAGFGDIRGHVHEDAINRLAGARDYSSSSDGITTACNREPLEFCAGTGVTKAQMAVFIFRALDWRQPNTIAESSRVPDNIFLTDYNEFSWYIKTQVVDRYGGDDQPWLQAAWNVTNRSTFDYMYSSYYMTGVHYGGAYPQVDHPHTVASAMTTRPDKFNLAYHPTFAHELAHVYTLSNRVSETPAALAAAHIYFSELIQGDARCGTYELLADTAKHLPFFYIRSDGYWGRCPPLPYVATSEAITVVREAFQGQMPGWFYDTFQGTGGDLDYDAIWEAVREIRDRRSRRVVVYQLQNSFGGYCSGHQVNEFLDGDARDPDTGISSLGAGGQPWVDGGCDGTAAAPDGESDADAVATTATASVRIVARKLAGGRVEFGLQQRDPDNSWADRRLPRVRFFPTSAGVNRWLASSALGLPPGDVRIVARRLADGRVEFGLQQRDPDNSWADRRLPRVRFFPTSAGVNRWLASSALTLTAPRTTPQNGTETPPSSTSPGGTSCIYCGYY